MIPAIGPPSLWSLPHPHSISGRIAARIISSCFTESALCPGAVKSLPHPGGRSLTRASCWQLSGIDPRHAARRRKP